MVTCQTSLSLTVSQSSPKLCPLNQWCHPTISSSATFFSLCLQSFPTSGSFPMSWLFASEGQMYWSFSFSINPYNEYSGLISFKTDWCSTVDWKIESSPTPQFKSINSLAFSLLHASSLTSVHDYWKNHSFDCMEFDWKVMSLLFNRLSRFVIVFLPSSKHLLISQLHSPSTLY